MFNLNIRHLVPHDDENLEPFREETDTFVTYLFNECKDIPGQYSLRMLHDAIENRKLSSGIEGLGPIYAGIWKDMEERYKNDPSWDKNLGQIREAYNKYQNIIQNNMAHESPNRNSEPVKSRKMAVELEL